MKRRSFFQQFILSSGGILLAPKIMAQAHNRKAKKITILHTNDTHSNIDPFPENHSKYPGMGGVAKRFEIIEKIRSEEQNVILLDAGDIFQGTPYFNTFNGNLEMKLMSKMGYDASTMGNHDFDIGLEGFKLAKKHANFPFLCSNYDFSNTLLKNETKPYHVFNKDGIKIGVFGIGVELDGLVSKGNYGDTVYQNPIKIANRTAEILKQEGCDLIICLSHLGFSYDSREKVSDLVLASQTKNIHVIIGGHTHTFLEKPIIEKNLIGELVLVNQVGWAGIQLGRIDIDISSKMKRKSNIEII
ncbi:MAG: bifunctional metallophosphatase/5'-nucleotidase [Flavobacteriales bacterium]|jgi:5'-nucleotidase|nr:bifunctional metallophosphatase/5'-nucleotidase [Flavobacteriales bacterium]